MLDVKMQDVKRTDGVAGHEIAGHENTGHENAGHENTRRENAGHETNKLGLKDDYMRDATVQDVVRCLMGLPLLPAGSAKRQSVRKQSQQSSALCREAMGSKAFYRTRSPDIHMVMPVYN